MKIILRIALPLLLLIATVGIAKKLVSSKKPPQKQQAKSNIAEVKVILVEPDHHAPPIKSYGTVRSFFETKLTSQVAGEITAITPDFRVGTHVIKGTVLAQIDSIDFQAALARDEANYSKYESTFHEETIKSEQAREDWLTSGRDIKKASPFVLRIPQLNAAKANMAASEAAIIKAKADLERCNIKAPFDAVVSERSASLGAYASAQSTLGSLISTERVTVRLPLTPDQTQRITLPSPNLKAQPITLSTPTHPGVLWSAELVRTMPNVDASNQVTYVIAEIHQPYANKHPLSVGSFVTAEIPAMVIEQSISVPEAALVKDAYIWLVDPSNKLVRADVNRLASRQGLCFLSLIDPKVEPPYRVVTRPLTNFRNGTKVHVLP